MLGTTANDLVLGFAGNDVINGGGGNDTLVGGAGNDTMYGGTTASDVVFMFAPGFGNDVINSFDATGGAGNQDFLDVAGFTGGLDITSANFSSRVHITAAGVDTLVTIEDGTAAHTTLGTIVIKGVTSGNITMADFGL